MTVQVKEGQLWFSLSLPQIDLVIMIENVTKLCKRVQKPLMSSHRTTLLNKRSKVELDVPVFLFFNKNCLSASQRSITVDSDLRNTCYPGRRTFLFPLSSVIAKDEFTIAI